MASSRRTYDTDSITLRTVFAKNPGNSNVPALRVLTADGTGGTYWAIPSSLGLNPSFNQIITSAGTYTADLSYNKFRLLAGENIGMVDGSAGSNQTTLFAKAFSQFDISGGNTVLAFSGGQLDPAVTFAGENGITLRADPGTNTFFIGGGTTSNTTISTGIYGFNQIKVTSATSTITSSVQGWSGEFLTANSPSTLLRLIGYNDIQLSTNVTTNSVYFTISTFTSEGYLNISNAAYSAYPSSISTIGGLYVLNSTFVSSFNYLSATSGGYFSTTQSSILALAISTGANFFLLSGLINARATIDQLNSEIGTVNSNLISTTQGLGSAGYISTAGGGSGDVTTANLVSTVVGLGTVGYVSTFNSVNGISTGFVTLSSVNLLDTRTNAFNSLTVSGATLLLNGAFVSGGAGGGGGVSQITAGAGISLNPGTGTGIVEVTNTGPTAANLTSTTIGLGTLGYLSSVNLINLVSTATLLSPGFVSTPNLTNLVSTSVLFSTVEGLGTYGYLSSFNALTMSTGTITALTVNLNDTITSVGNNLTVSGATLLLNGQFITGGAGGGGGGGVTQLIAGTGISISPGAGVGIVTITNTGALVNQLVSTPNLLNLVSTPTLLTPGYVSTPNLTNLVSTATLLTPGFVSTPNLLNLVSTATLLTPGFVSTPNLLNLVSTSVLFSTVEGLGTIGYISTQSGGGAQVTDSNIASTLRYSGYFSSIKIGYNAAYSGQSNNAIAIGNSAGSNNQGLTAIAIGRNAGISGQLNNAIAIGTAAGSNNQGTGSIAIGNNAGYSSQNDLAVTIGFSAGSNNQGLGTVAIGYQAGQTNQTTVGVAIGYQAGFDTQNAATVAIGQAAGYSNQGAYSVGIGYQAGYSNQKQVSIAIGCNAGNTSQGAAAVALGPFAGYSNQGISSIAIGARSGYSNQGNNSIAIGTFAGYESQAASSIVISALASTLNVATEGLFIAPLRYIEGNQDFGLGYNSSTFEIGLTYGLSNWSYYQATNQVTLASTNATIVNPTPYDPQYDVYYAMKLQTTQLNVYDINNAPGSVSLGSLSFTTSSFNQTYSLGAEPLITGTISSLALAHYDGTTLKMGSLFLSSLYLGSTTGKIFGQLTTDETATNLYWKGTQLNGGGGGGITTTNLTSTVIGLGTVGYISTAGGGGGGITTAELISTIEKWARYPAISSIVFSTTGDTNQIVSPGSTFFQLVTDVSVLVTTSTTVDGISPFRGVNASQYSIADQVNITTLGDFNYTYTLTAGQSYTGPISTPTITNYDGSLGSLYLSSLFLAAPEGAASGTASPLTTDITASKLYFSTNQLANVKVNVVHSSLGVDNPQLYSYDIGKYFLFSTANAGLTVGLPPVENGWNAVIKNMEGGTQNFTVATQTPAVLAPGVVTTVVCDGISFYSL